MDKNNPNSVKAFLIFILCVHCIESMFKEISEVIEEPLEKLEPLDLLLIDKELSKYFLYWSTELVWQYSETPEIADHINPLLISMFEEKYPIKFDEVREYADVPEGSSDIIQIFGKNINSILGKQCAILIYQLSIISNSNLKALIPSIRNVLSMSDDELIEMNPAN